MVIKMQKGLMLFAACLLLHGSAWRGDGAALMLSLTEKVSAK
jgi:hypothetical protein